MKYRFAWTFPLRLRAGRPEDAVSGGNRVFRTATKLELDANLARPELERPGAASHSVRADARTRGRRGARPPAPARPFAAPRMGRIWEPRRTTGWCTSRATAQEWRKVTPKAMPSWLRRLRRDLGARRRHRLRSRPRATSSRLASPTCFRHQRRRQELEGHQRRPAQGEITRVVRADAQRGRAAFRRHRDRHLLQRRRRPHWQRMKGGLPVTRCTT